MMFLTLKKVRMVKYTPPQILTTPQKIPPAKFLIPPFPQHYLENPAQTSSLSKKSILKDDLS